MMSGLELQYPYFLLFGVFGFSFWLIGLYRPFKKAEIRLPKRYLRKGSFFKKSIVIVVSLLAWFMLAFSVSIPRKPSALVKNNTEINDIFFVVDVSLSMTAIDFKPNRLEVAKKKILEFIKMMPTDRIGIIMFAHNVYTLLPLTTDLKLIERVIDEIQVGFLGTGTNIGDALALAVGRGAQSLAENKTIILLTDGVSNFGFMTPLQAAEEAKKQNMKIYTIAIGGDQDAKMPVGRSRYQRIPGGSFDLETLKKIAETTGGKDFVAKSEGALKEVLGEIEKLERKEIDISSRIIYEYKHYYFLVIGAFLFVLSEILRRLWLKEGE